MDQDIGEELSSLLGQLQTQKQQVDGLLKRKGSLPKSLPNEEAGSEKVASRSAQIPSTRQVELEKDISPSIPSIRADPPPSAQRNQSPSVLNTPSLRLGNGDRFDIGDLYEMLPTLEWDKLFKQVEIAAQEKGKKGKRTPELNSFEDEVALLKHQVSSSDMQAQDAQSREVRLHAEMRDREERLQKVAGSTLLACLDLQNSLERVAALHMSGQKIQAPNGPVVQLRLPVENECLKELDACRSKIKHLELTASNAADGNVAAQSTSVGGMADTVHDPLSDVSRTPPPHILSGDEGVRRDWLEEQAERLVKHGAALLMRQRRRGQPASPIVTQTRHTQSEASDVASAAHALADTVRCQRWQASRLPGVKTVTAAAHAPRLLGSGWVVFMYKHAITDDDSGSRRCAVRTPCSAAHPCGDPSDFTPQPAPCAAL